MNGYFRALIQLLTKSRTLLRPTVAFGRFLAEPAFHRAGDEGRHTAQQLADIRAQSESDASDAAELKEAAKLAAEKIVKADIRKAQEAGLGYEEFRSKYRPVGGDAVSSIQAPPTLYSLLATVSVSVLPFFVIAVAAQALGATP